MALYIKANPKVARFLNLDNDRNVVKDGNYLLWQADMLAFGRLTDLPQILIQIGAIALRAHEAREEQDGTVSRELPVAADPRFVIESGPAPEHEDDPMTDIEIPEQEESSADEAENMEEMS
ncbi:MAG: hypothetical protein IAB75_01430 [Bacteroidetes bacterium]|uniref:Uncharacterized protein n=1 Tax=Candidatus Cryptobacteroides avicola TaxID=2840757 RepID=A0A940DPR6_9BACT|nr:hypothetical protein [Candidatus Cryptobacteroides avicola]